MGLFDSKSSLDGPINEKPNKKDVGPIENLLRNMIRDDASEFGNKIIENTVMPTLLGLVKEIGHNTIDYIFKSGNGDYYYTRRPGEYTNYRGISDGSGTANNRSSLNGYITDNNASSNRRSFDSRDYTFTRGEAEFIKDELQTQILRLGKVDLATFLRHTNTVPTWNDTTIGWTDLSNILMREVNTPDGKRYVLFLPPLVSIKNV